MLEVRQLHLTREELDDFLNLQPKELVLKYRKRYINLIYQSLTSKLPPLILPKEELVILLKNELKNLVEVKKIKILTLENNENYKQKVILKFKRYKDKELKKKYTVQQLLRYLKVLQYNNIADPTEEIKGKSVFNLTFTGKKQNIINQIREELQK